MSRFLAWMSVIIFTKGGMSTQRAWNDDWSLCVGVFGGGEGYWKWEIHFEDVEVKVIVAL